MRKSFEAPGLALSLSLCVFGCGVSGGGATPHDAALHDNQLSIDVQPMNMDGSSQSDGSVAADAEDGGRVPDANVDSADAPSDALDASSVDSSVSLGDSAVNDSGVSDSAVNDSNNAAQDDAVNDTSDSAVNDGASNVIPTPWSMQSCGGAPITERDVLSHFAPAATSARFGTVYADARKRRCQDQTGCQGWEPAASVDLYRIVWVGQGFSFQAPTTLALPASGTILCQVPGPRCQLEIGRLTSNVYPPEQGRPLGITPRVDGSQVQVGNWSFDPRGNYLQYTTSVVTRTCLFGSMVGRVYEPTGARVYIETELVIWGNLG